VIDDVHVPHRAIEGGAILEVAGNQVDAGFAKSRGLRSSDERTHGVPATGQGAREVAAREAGRAGD
jgi:hypothetical protein